MRRVLLIFAFVVLLPAMAAADISLNAVAEPDHIQPGDVFKLTITVEGKGLKSLPEAMLPQLKAFEIVSKSSSQQMSMVNLALKMTNITTYIVRAPRTGKFEVPSVSAEYQGKKYQTEPITITVDPSAPKSTVQAAPQMMGMGGMGGMFPDLDKFFNPDVLMQGRPQQLGRDDILVDMSVDKKDVVPFQQVMATFSFYRSVDLWDQPTYQKPEFKGFWMEEMPFPGGQKELTTREQLNGRSYTVTRIRYALFPLTSGKHTIDPVTIIAAVDPWTGGKRYPTKPVQVDVHPFPEKNKPRNFMNMVGSFAVTAMAEPNKIAVNETLTLRVIVEGDGYLKQVGPPPKPNIEGFEVFDAKVTDTVDKTQSKVVSKKVIEYPMVAKVEGRKALPPFEFSWYDPLLKDYVRHATESVVILVTAPTPGQQQAQTPAAPQQRTDIASVKTGIRFIKQDTGYLDDHGDPPHRWGWLLILLALPAPSIALGWAYKKRKERLARDIAFARQKNAYKNASKKLTDASKMDKPGDFYAMLDQAVRGYLGDVWNLPAPSVDKDVVREKFGAAKETAEKFVKMLDDMEYARYAPVFLEERDERLAQLRELIGEMEKGR